MPARSAYMQGMAVIAGKRPVLQVAHAHAPPALATQDEALQSGRALAHGPRTVFGAKGAVVSPTAADGGGTGSQGIEAGCWVVEHNGPVLPRHEAGTAFDPRSFAGQEPGAGLGAAIDVRPGIGRMMQDC